MRRSDWRREASRLIASVVPENVERVGWVLGACPWQEWLGVEWSLDGVKSDDSVSDREAALSRLRGLGTLDMLLYTDGSAVEGVSCGGAGVVVTRGDPGSPERVDTLSCAAGLVTSSYQAELRALWVALKWLSECDVAWYRVAVASDSQAALEALREASGGGGDRVSAWLGEVVRMGRELGRLGKRVVFVWVPGHRGLVGNEWADRAAAEASLLDQSGVECLYSSIRSVCRRREVVVFEHERCRRVYGEGMRWDLERGWERGEAVSMARLRSGHSLELGGYRRRIGLEGSGTCRRCGEDVVESVEHVLSCVAGERMRFNLGLSDHLSVLCCRPREAMDYWRWWRRVRLK